MRNSLITEQKKILVTGVAYFVLGALILYWYGIQTSGEAEKYIDNANRILDGRVLRNGSFGIFYLSYSLIVALFVKFSISLNLVAVLQLILSFFSGFCLYRLLKVLLGNERMAFLFFLIFLLCYPIQRWNFFLYSESLHISLTVICTWTLFKLSNKGTLANWIIFLFVFIALFFSRPTGAIFGVALLTAAGFFMWRNGKSRVALLILAVLLGGAFLLFRSPLANFINPDSLRRMEVICQVPETNDSIPYTEFNKAGLGEVFSVIKDEIGFGNFFKAGFTKLGKFYGMVRPYYSTGNNLLLALYWILYPFALAGIFMQKKGHRGLIPSLAALYLLFTSLAIFMTCDDWANRFIGPAFPFIIILAAIGVRRVFRIGKDSLR